MIPSSIRPGGMMFPPPMTAPMQAPDTVDGDIGEALRSPTESVASGHSLGGGASSGEAELREKFSEFVGQTFFGTMLASMRKSVGKSAYMHGGRGEEVFTKQLDQVLVQELTEASADQIAGPLFDLFQMQRRP